MVTKGYQKGVYKWVTFGNDGGTGGYGPSQQYVSCRLYWFQFQVLAGSHHRRAQACCNSLAFITIPNARYQFSPSWWTRNFPRHLHQHVRRRWCCACLLWLEPKQSRFSPGRPTTTPLPPSSTPSYIHAHKVEQAPPRPLSSTINAEVSGEMSRPYVVVPHIHILNEVKRQQQQWPLLTTYCCAAEPDAPRGGRGRRIDRRRGGHPDADARTSSLRPRPTGWASALPEPKASMAWPCCSCRRDATPAAAVRGECWPRRSRRKNSRCWAGATCPPTTAAWARSPAPPSRWCGSCSSAATGWKTRSWSGGCILARKRAERRVAEALGPDGRGVLRALDVVPHDLLQGDVPGAAACSPIIPTWPTRG